jgi:alcohol dehydrogenase class IV
MFPDVLDSELAAASRVDADQEFNFFPVATDVYFGFGVLDQLAERARGLGASKVLVVSDPGLRQSGAVGRVEGLLRHAGVPFATFDRVPANGSDGTVAEAVALLKEYGADLVVGLGGGSSLDAAKAVAIMGTNPGNILDYAGYDKVRVDPLPVIAIPTAAGTGSEVSIWSVVTEDATKVKKAVGSKKALPRAALCDPELTVSLPPALTAATGLDALGHAMEAFVNKRCQPISGALAICAIQLVGRHLRTAVADGANRKARYGMLLASTMALMAMNPTRCGIAHALAMPLGSWDLDIHHGLLVGMLLPEVMEFNHVGAPERYAAVARALGEDVTGLTVDQAAARSVEAVRKLVRDVRLPRSLSELGVTEAHIPRVLEVAIKSDNILINPRMSDKADLEAIVRKLM